MFDPNRRTPTSIFLGREAVKALDTQYAGCYFRSRLEARWAVFFDFLHINWMYEPQGFELDSGDWYLPDFYLPDLDIWFEVKGVADPLGLAKFNEFAAAMDNYRCAIAMGDIPRPEHVNAYSTEQLQIDTGHDYNYAWCRCGRCGRYGIEFEGRSFRLPCKCFDTATEGDRGHNADETTIVCAYNAARSARF